MVSMTALCAALMLVCVAVFLSEQERRRIDSALRVLEWEQEHCNGRLVSGRDMRRVLQNSGLWSLSERAIHDAFMARYRGHAPTQSRRRRQRIVAHVLGRCGERCSICRHTWLATSIARNEGRFDRWIAMSSEELAYVY